MPHFLVTYDFKDTARREDFVDTIEEVLSDLGLQKQDTNQSTYFGHYQGTAQSFVKDLHNITAILEWHRDDQLTVYYPKANEPDRYNKKYPDMGVHHFKESGNTFVHHVIYQP